MPAYQHKSLSMVTKLRRERGFAYRIAVTFVALLAFTLQSYVTQTHIHLEAQPNLGFSISKDAASDTASKVDLPRKIVSMIDIRQATTRRTARFAKKCCTQDVSWLQRLLLCFNSPLASSSLQ